MAVRPHECDGRVAVKVREWREMESTMRAGLRAWDRRWAEAKAQIRVTIDGIEERGPLARGLTAIREPSTDDAVVLEARGVRSATT